MHTKETTNTSSSSSDSDLDVGTARHVYYQEGDKSLVSTFTGATLVLVCHGHPLHRVQFP